MKNLSILIALLLIAPICLFAQVNTKSETIEPDPDLATVVFYRTADAERVMDNWGIFNHQERICKLSSYKYLVYKTSQGVSDFRGQAWGILKRPENQEGLELPLEKGEIYYVKVDISAIPFNVKMIFSEVTERTAVLQLKDMKPDRCNRNSEKT